MSSAWHIRARALGTAAATQSCSQGRPTLASHRTTLSSWTATYQGSSRAGPMPSAHPEPPAVCWHDACIWGWGLLKGCRVPWPPCPQCVPPTGRALREALQASMSCSGRPQPGHGSPTCQLSSSHPCLENLTFLQGSTTFKKILIHIAAVQERAALLSYLISKGCCVLDAEENPLLSLWTCGSQKAAIADLWISINIHHLQWNLT